MDGHPGGRRRGRPRPGGRMMSQMNCEGLESVSGEGGSGSWRMESGGAWG